MRNRVFSQHFKSPIAEMTPVVTNYRTGGSEREMIFSLKNLMTTWLSFVLVGTVSAYFET